MMNEYEIARLLPNLKPRYVYGIQSGQFIKIGVTMNIAERLNDFRLSNPHKLTVVYRRKVLGAYHCEKKMHEILNDKALGREWFDVTRDEVLAAGLVGIAYAKQICQEQATTILLTRSERKEYATADKQLILIKKSA